MHYDVFCPLVGPIVSFTCTLHLWYSRVHKSSDSFFSKILEKPSISSLEKNDTSYKRAKFFTEMKQKKWKMTDLENSKWQPQKNPSFPAPPILIFFHEIYMGWSLNAKNTFFACFWAYVRQPHSHKSWDKPMSFALINSAIPRTNPWKFWIFKLAILNFFFASSHWKMQPISMRDHFFLPYGWFFQNLRKEAVRTFMHTTVCYNW